MHRITPKVVALIVAVVAFATAAFAQPASDHLACYGVKDRVRKGPSTLTLMNASVTQSCRIGSRAQLVCPKPFPPAAEMTDEFGGTRVVRFSAAQFLCAPATRSTETTGSTTTSTTLAPSSCDFNSDERRCEGTCGNGGQCSAITSGGACECRTTPCGDADAPECDGFCGAGESCTFDVTRCSCLNIP